MGVKRLTAEQFQDYVYNKMPEYYRQQDKKVDYHLKKFLGTLHDGAFNYTIEEANGILDIIDPDRTPSEVLPILFRSYGLEIFYGLPEPYSRMLLSIIGFLWGYKGTEMAVRYLVSLLAEVNVTVDTEDSGALLGKGLLGDMIFGMSYPVSVRLDMDSQLDGVSKFPDRESLMRIIKEFIPFYCSTTIIYYYFFHDYMNIKSMEIYADHITVNAQEDSASFRAVGLLNPYNAVFNGSGSGGIGAGSALFGEMVFGNTDFMEVDHTSDHALMLEDESALVDKDADYLEEDVVIAVQHDIIRSRAKDQLADIISEQKEDGGTFNSVGNMDEDCAVFNSDGYGNSALFGELILGNGDYVPADYYEDSIKTAYTDSASLPCDGMDGEDSLYISKSDPDAGTLSASDYTVNTIAQATLQNAVLLAGRIGSMVMGDSSFTDIGTVVT